MRLKEYVRTHDGAKLHNRINSIAILGSLGSIFILAFMAFNKEERVLLSPVTLTEDAWVLSDDASQSYKEAWGHYLATTIGNITPQNVDFVVERVKPLLSKRIYTDVTDQMYMQAQDIRDDRVSMRFEPREIQYESATDKVFVSGSSFVKAADSDESKSDRTFEFIIKISNYTPTVTALTSYEGKALDQQMLKNLAARKEKENS